MRVAIHTFGCQMNEHDSGRLVGALLAAGHQLVAQPEQADLVVLNTCSVREKAEQKLRSEVGRLRRRRRSGAAPLLVVAGCMAQQHGRALLARMPSVDILLGPDQLAELPALVDEVRRGGGPLVRLGLDTASPAFLRLPDAAGSGATAYVTTMKGCDERCTFCVVPNTRGPERYRPSTEIVAEVAALVARGVREVTLLGQTVNSYRDPAGALAPAPDRDGSDPGETEFAALLWAIAERVPALARLRYAAPHPRHLSRSLVRAHREIEMLARHIHLPVQSGSDRVLKRMHRRHDRANYLARVRAVQRAVGDVTVSTDVIVGFSGETEADFAETLSLVEQVPHIGVFGFKYSLRPDTPAARLPDDVPEAVKAERLARLFALSERQQLAHHQALVGATEQVLVEGPSKTHLERLSGRTGRNEIVHLEGAARLDLVGRIVEVEIVEAFKHSLLGRLSERARRRALAATAAARPGRRHLPLVGGGSAEEGG